MRRRYANAMYRIEATQSGDEIDQFKTFREAMAALNRYEKQDRRDGVFTPGFYTIARFTNGWYQPYYDSKHGYLMSIGPRAKPRKKSPKRPRENDYGIKGDWRPFEGM